MIRSGKQITVLSAAIAVLMLLAALPAGAVATTVLFEDDFQSPSWSSNWSDSFGPIRVCQGSNCYLRFDSNGEDITSILINATCMKNITVSYDRKTSDYWGTSDDHFRSYYSTDGGLSWVLLYDITSPSSWWTSTSRLPVEANDNPNLRLWFDAIITSFAEEAYLDNVTVTGELMDPRLEVNKTVWNGTAWVKSLDTKINDTLRFKSTIRNSGNINLTEIRFWDILDCSLNYSGNATLNGEPFTCFETESNPFKPKMTYIYYPDFWTPSDDPVGGFSMDVCPQGKTYYEIVGWEDTDDKGTVSACDQLQLATSEYMSSGAVFEDDFESLPLWKWWDYSDVAPTAERPINDFVVFDDHMDDLKSVPIAATCNMTLVLSFDLKTINWDLNPTWDYYPDHFYVNYSLDNFTWTTLADINETIDWTTFTYTLPCTVNNQNIWLWFSAMEWDDPANEEMAWLDNVTITCQGWYHVDRMPYALALYNESLVEYHFDSVLNWDDMDLSNPNQTRWFGLCGCRDTYTLLNWTDLYTPGFSVNDPVTMRNERTLEEVQYTVSGVGGHLLALSREWEIATLLEPEANITIEYNATVVRCGVDNNTLRAKGFGECGDNWKYSDPAVVTITVPCPSGDAANETLVIKDVYSTGEDVYALGRDFAPNKSVDIYITPVRTWVFGDTISDYARVGPVSVVTDANGSIGIEPKVLMWSDPVPGEYHMVFDDPDGIFEQGIDLFDYFEVIGGAEVKGVAVPVVTPPGLVALIGLLSVVAISTLVRRRRR